MATQNFKQEASNFKRGQSALEFLTTYGWAFLIILIMIGALSYFGILSPSKLLPDRCNFGAQFACIDEQIAAGTGATGTVKVRLKNSLGAPIAVSSTAIWSDSSVALACTAPSSPSSWKSGDVQEFTWTACSSPPLVKGEKFKAYIALSFYDVTSGPGYAKNSTGEVYVTVV